MNIVFCGGGFQRPLNDVLAPMRHWEVDAREERRNRMVFSAASYLCSALLGLLVFP